LGMELATILIALLPYFLVRAQHPNCQSPKAVRSLAARDGQRPFVVCAIRWHAHRFDKLLRKRDGEKLTQVHMPVFLLATNTSAAFCKTVIAAVMLAIPTGP
jgi:hypothetical protein